MKKVLLVLLSLSLIVTTISCGETDKAKEEHQARQIITYFNTMLDVTKRLYPPDHLDKILNYMEKQSHIRVQPIIVRSRDVDSAAVKFPAWLPAEVQVEIASLWQTYFEAGDAFFDNWETYKEYLQNETYRTDQWERGRALYEENFHLYDLILDTKSEIIGILDPISDDAEALLMVDNVYEDYIFTGKGIISLSDDLINEFAEAEVDARTMENLAGMLKSRIEAARKLPDVPRQQTDMRLYSDFLDVTEEFLNEVEKANRIGRYGVGEFNTAYSKYSRIIERYNRFIDN